MPSIRRLYPHLFALPILLLGTSTYANGADDVLRYLSGYVLSGNTPIADAKVRLYEAGTRHRGSGAKVLGHTTTDIEGYYHLTYKTDGGSEHSRHPKIRHSVEEKSKPVLYLMAQGNNGGAAKNPIRLAAVLDNAHSSGEVFVNERTTVALAYAMAQLCFARQNLHVALNHAIRFQP